MPSRLPLWSSLSPQHHTEIHPKILQLLGWLEEPPMFSPCQSWKRGNLIRFISAASLVAGRPTPGSRGSSFIRSKNINSNSSRKKYSMVREAWGKALVRRMASKSVRSIYPACGSRLGLSLSMPWAISAESVEKFFLRNLTWTSTSAFILVHDLTNAQFAKEASRTSVTSPTTKEGISTLSKYKDML